MDRKFFEFFEILNEEAAEELGAAGMRLSDGIRDLRAGRGTDHESWEEGFAWGVLALWERCARRGVPISEVENVRGRLDKLVAEIQEIRKGKGR